ncbi:MAG TPA: DUF2231 domain-containing protein [Acidimicrobiales bacterium]|nr:DUF2231 domain-containing protein [Acidimicrobiales bacterium]
MPKLFSIRPSLAVRGRKFKGLRGFAGKPFHPPLTDIPVAAYILVMAFDIVSAVAGDDSTLARDFFVSGTHVLVAGAVVALPTALTGFWDWWRSTEPGTQAWRTANWHMAVMVFVTAVVIADIVLRLSSWEDPVVPTSVLVLSIVAGVLVAYGSIYGGALVYEYGFNVETSGDHPAWHRSDVDVLHGRETPPA